MKLERMMMIAIVKYIIEGMTELMTAPPVRSLSVSIRAMSVASRKVSMKTLMIVLKKEYLTMFFTLLTQSETFSPNEKTQRMIKAIKRQKRRIVGKIDCSKIQYRK